MTLPDIVVGRETTTVINTVELRETEDGEPKIRIRPGGSGRLELGSESVSERSGEHRDGADDGAWDIAFAPKWATVNLGGGAGENSDGDLKLYDNPDQESAKPRIHLSGGTGSTSDSTRVQIEGSSDGRIELGQPGQSDDLFRGRTIELTTRIDSPGALAAFFDDYFGRVDAELEERALLRLGKSNGRNGALFITAGDNDVNVITEGFLRLGAEEFPGEVVLKNAAGNVAGRIQGGDTGLVLTDPNGDPAIEIESDGTVLVQGQEVQPGE